MSAVSTQYRIAAALTAGLVLCLGALAGPDKRLDPLDDGQWYANALKLKAAQSISTGTGVTVAVVDTGVDADHPTLRGRVLSGADFSESASSSSGDGHRDDDGHGTAMASLIVGMSPIAGVAPKAQILPIRVAEEAKRTNFAAGIQWAVDHGANVINISAGSPLPDPREKSAINNALNHNIVVVASVGNLPEASAIQFPARYPGVLAVAAVTQSGTQSSLSVPGHEVLLSAPGENISSARPNGQYAINDGTSDSAALVAGVVALVRSKFPDMPAAEVVRRLTATATDAGPPGRDDMFGFGIVNPVAALTAQVAAPASSSPVATTPDVNGEDEPDGSGNKLAFRLAVFGGLILLVLLVAAGAVAIAVVAQRKAN